MKKFTQHFLAMSVTAGLGLASISAYAATPDQHTSLIFSAHDSAIFGNSIRAGLDESGDQFSFHTDSGMDDGSFIKGYNGSNFSAAIDRFNLDHAAKSNSNVAEGLNDPDLDAHFEHSVLNSDKSHGLHNFDSEFNPGKESFHCGSIPVSPVPEPAEYLLMACGFALLGFITNRRKSKFFLFQA